MIKMVCDKCGKEVYSVAFPHLPQTSKILITSGINTREYDLCKSCLWKVREFITADTPQTEEPYIDIETGILHWCGWEYRRIEDEPQTDCGWK